MAESPPCHDLVPLLQVSPCVTPHVANQNMTNISWYCTLSSIYSWNVILTTYNYWTITRNEEEFEEEFDDDDFEMIQNIVEDPIQNNSEITAQQIIWREKHVEIDQAE